LKRVAWQTSNLLPKTLAHVQIVSGGSASCFHFETMLLLIEWQKDETHGVEEG